MHTILVVDDEPLVLNVVCRTLTAHGYRVVPAGSPQAALVAGDSLPHLDLLVSDIEMPGINGRQLANLMLERYPAMAVLFMTGYLLRPGVTSPDGRLDGHHLIHKPFLPAQLVKAVSHLLDTASFVARA
jgi:CheY-like chemotaxis protein